MAGVNINTLTMEQYLALSRENQAPGVVKLEIRGNVNFEIKSQFMRELREDTFSGNKNEDAHDRIDRVLTAKRWVDRLALGTINTWDLLKKAFIQRYCSPSKTAKQLEDIHNFAQEGDESLYQAREQYNDLLYKCPTHDINRDQFPGWMLNLRRTSPQKGLPLNEEVKQVEEVRYGEFRRTTPFNENNGGNFHVGPPGYYTKTDNRPPYGERRQSLEELLAKHQEESAQRITANQETSVLNKLHGVSFISETESATPDALQHQLPPKELNPGSFTLLCTIGKFNFYVMDDLGASINVMPKSIFEHLHLTNLKKKNMLCEMADMSKKAPLGIFENVLVKIDKFC
ncbi:putative reverse transcriptase domain-containing protein [Tanacetum coccineum]